uniref:Uncharacterized protein n=1 Tax=Aegilops tauschii subsp. strangulata TaxID=200361 RepID=A0A453JZ28_AEGTS
GRVVDRHSGDPGESVCSVALVKNLMRLGSIGATAALSPPAGPTKKRAAAHCMGGGTKAGANKGLDGLMLKAHTG